MKLSMKPEALSVRKGNVQRAPDDYSGFPCAKHSDEPP